MDHIPEKVKLAKLNRRFFERFEKKLILPMEDPYLYHAFAVVLAVATLYVKDMSLVPAYILGIVFLDWLAGSTTRRYKLETKERWAADIVVDRITEFFVIIPFVNTDFGKFFLFMYCVNVALCFYSLKLAKSIPLTLKIFLGIFLILK